jgi:hypothetical protein
MQTQNPKGLHHGQGMRPTPPVHRTESAGSKPSGERKLVRQGGCGSVKLGDNFKSGVDFGAMPEDSLKNNAKWVVFVSERCVLSSSSLSG